MRILKLTLGLIVLILSSCLTKDDIVIKEVNVISMTENRVFKSSVYISNGVIKKIGDYSNFKLSEDVTIIDGTGKYITPGFSDMHVHAYRDEDMALFLANGVTTIRNMWGDEYHLNKRKNENDSLSPRIFTTTPLIDGYGSRWDGATIITNPEDVEILLKTMKNDGYDYIKVYDLLSRDVFFKIMEVSKKLNIKVVGHVPYKVDILEAINSGMFSIEHFAGYNIGRTDSNKLEEAMTLSISKEVWNCPTLIQHKNYDDLRFKARTPEKFTTDTIPELKYANPENLKWWKYASGYNMKVEETMEFVQRLYLAGGNIVSGTDQINPYIIPGFSLHREFKLLNQAGLTPYEVLLTTTVNPASMLGLESTHGTIEEGKVADIVLLEKNPLEDIENTKTIAGVISKGRWISKDLIDTMLSEVEKSYSSK